MPEPRTPIRYVIGVDGGGSGTRARVASLDGAMLGAADAGPSALGQGTAQAWTNVRHVLDAAFSRTELRIDPAQCALGLGLSGANVARRREAFLAAAREFEHIALDTDAYTTLLGAHRGEPGAIVASGTGSVGEALRRSGLRVSIGGWGFPVGDEGSGAWLGMRAMRRAHHALDGWAPVSPLVHSVWDVAGSTRESLLGWCERAGQHAYARLAPLVFDAAGTDPWAASLLDAAVRSLESIANALDPDGTLPLSVFGSIGTRLQPRLAARIRARCVAPAGDAIDGAMRLVRQTIGLTAR
jgi:glucosamine kinase